MLRKGVVWMAIAGMIVAGVYQWFFSMTRVPISQIPTQTVISIVSGTTLGGISKQLHESGLVDYPIVFNALVRMSKMENKLRAGDYKVDTAWTYQELMDHLVNDPEVQYPITLIEGMTLVEAMRIVQSNEKIKRDFADTDTREIARLLAIADNAEGMLLPDTYFIRARTSESEFYKRANQALTELLTREWPKRAEGLPFKNAYEAVVAASVVEKETGVPSERPMIAAAIVQRLKKGIPLQMDPTVIYGLGSRFDGNIHKKDLSDPSPYNTYMHKGLPPTPIALASAESIYAVLHPANSEAIYFVAKGDGSHQFSVTLEEHNAAVRKYQLGK
jgi:UPF0755 protein